MLDIRANRKDIECLRRVKRRLHNTELTLNEDSAVDVPVVMVHTSSGELVELGRGFGLASSLVKYGYIRNIRKCPIRHRRCIGEKCSFYWVKGITGDCAHIWQAELLWKGHMEAES